MRNTIQILDQHSKTVLHQVSSADMDEKVPTLSLHMIVKNAESVIDRTLKHVLPYLTEVHIVLNDTTDRTRDVIEGMMKDWPAVSFEVQLVTAESHPLWYIKDVPETYASGKSLAGEEFEGPFTEQSVLCDWSSVRNFGWDSSCDYRLQLDADDMLEDPAELPFALRALEHTGADLAASHYQIAGTTRRVYRERLARNTPIIRWDGKIHDTLVGGLRRVLLEDLLTTVDKRDNKGTGIRVVARDFKVLYYLARQAEWKVSLRHLAYLIQEARHLMPLEWVAGPLLGLYKRKFDAVGVPSGVEEKAWVHGMIGEVYEDKGDLYKADLYYRAALTAHPSQGLHWRLARALYRQERFGECLRSYDDGCLMAHVPPPVMDLSPVPDLGLLVLVSDSLSRTGQHQDGLKVLKAVRAVVDSPSLQALEAEITARMNKG